MEKQTFFLNMLLLQLLSIEMFYWLHGLIPLKDFGIIKGNEVNLIEIKGEGGSK